MKNFCIYHKMCWLYLCRQTSQFHSAPPWKILFFGSDTFSLQSLLSLKNEQKNGQSIGKLDIVTTAENNAVGKYCKQKNISYYKWPPDIVKGFYDFGIVVSFGHLLPPTLIEKFPLGLINVHASLLPRWRGGAPIVHAILNNDSVTGVSIMKIEPYKFDIGKVLSQVKISVPKNCKSKELSYILADVGAAELINVVINFRHKLESSWQQGTVGVTKAPKIKEHQAKIDWQSVTCFQLHCKYRAFDDYFPLFTTWHGISIKLRDFVLEPPALSFHNHNSYSDELKNINCEEGIITDNSTVSVGYVQYIKPLKVLRVTCSDGMVDLRTVSLKGRKQMTAKDFYNGFMSKLPPMMHFFGT